MTTADEDRAKDLGFVFDERRQKWRHPDCPEYAASRVKYALEDYPDIVRSRAARDAIRTRNSSAGQQ
jgi:HEAT repeat protein